MWNEGQIGQIVWTIDIRNTLWVPLTTTITMGRSILLWQSKPRSLTESVPLWLTSCNKFACAKHWSRFTVFRLRLISVCFWWSVCDQVVVGCGHTPPVWAWTQKPRFWCLRRAGRFGQREHSLPYAWKSFLSVALLGLCPLLALADFAYT